MVQKNAHFPCVKRWPPLATFVFAERKPMIPKIIINNNQNYMHAFNENNIHRLINFTGKYKLHIETLVEFRKTKTTFNRSNNWVW